MFLDKLGPEAPEKPRIKRSSKTPKASRKNAVVVVVLVVVLLAGGGATAWWFTTQQSEAGRLRNETVSYDANEATTKSSDADVSTLTNDESTAFDDSDDDGLLDELEDLYRTDADAADTDGDGFDDGTEIENGYDPRIGSTNVRMTDLALVEKIGQSVASPMVVSSGIATSTNERYYLVFDGTSTSYFGADGTLKAQCVVEEEPTGACATLPNEVRTDFSRSFNDGETSDSYHVPF